MALDLLVPQEINDAIAASGLPGIQVVTAPGKAKAEALKLLKSKKARKAVKDYLDRSDAGRLWNDVGHQFEKFFAEHVLPNADREVPQPSGKVADFVWREALIELKTARTLSDSALSQLKGLASDAKNAGKRLVYIFLEEPTPKTIKDIEAQGGEVFHLYEKG